jgi:hypothetical protein
VRENVCVCVCVCEGEREGEREGGGERERQRECERGCFTFPELGARGVGREPHQLRACAGPRVPAHKIDVRC